MSDFRCGTCSPYTRLTDVPGSCGGTCLRPRCGVRDIITVDGQCKECGPEEDVSSDQLSCKERPRCGKRQYRGYEGICKSCEPYQKLNRDGRGCGYADCPAGYKVEIDGTCT